MMPNAPLPIDEIEGRPILVVETTPYRIVVIDCDRIIHPHVLHGSANPDKLAEAEQLATEGRDMFLHQSGARRPDALNPDNWAIDAHAFSIPASRVFMSRMLMNMEANVPHYP